MYMLKQLPTRFSLIAVLLGLTACATVPPGAVQTSAQPTSSSSADKVSLGSLIAVPPGVGVDGNHARVVDEYFSASGRRCVRVELKQAGSSTRVICQRESGKWSFTRSLFNDKIPLVNDEQLITTPFNGIESNSAEFPEVDQTSVTDKFGTTFETHYAPLLTFGIGSLWNFVGTSTAGPTKWTQLTVASAASVLELVGSLNSNESIAGSR
jgi:hypothetical protein